MRQTQPDPLITSAVIVFFGISRRDGLNDKMESEEVKFCET